MLGTVLGVVGTVLGVVGWAGEVLVIWPDGLLTLRLGDKLEIALWTAPPQPAVRHTTKMAAKRKKPCV